MVSIPIRPTCIIAMKIDYEVVRVFVYMKGEKSLGLYSININPCGYYYDSSQGLRQFGVKAK